MSETGNGCSGEDCRLHNNVVASIKRLREIERAGSGHPEFASFMNIYRATGIVMTAMEERVNNGSLPSEYGPLLHSARRNMCDIYRKYVCKSGERHSLGLAGVLR